MFPFDQGNPTLKSDDPGQTWVISTWLMNKYKNDMSPVAFKEHMNYICCNYDPVAADAMYERYNEREDIEDTTASRLFAQSKFARNTFRRIGTKEKETKKRILAEYASADHVRQHAREMGSICLVMGTPYKEGFLWLSLDRSLDDMHHRPEDCLLMGTHLNIAKAAHAAFRTQEALAQHCRENGVDESASNHAKISSKRENFRKSKHPSILFDAKDSIHDIVSHLQDQFTMWNGMEDQEDMIRQSHSRILNNVE